MFKHKATQSFWRPPRTHLQRVAGRTLEQIHEAGHPVRAERVVAAVEHGQLRAGRDHALTHRLQRDRNLRLHAAGKQILPQRFLQFRMLFERFGNSLGGLHAERVSLQVQEPQAAARVDRIDQFLGWKGTWAFFFLLGQLVRKFCSPL